MPRALPFVARATKLFTPRTAGRPWPTIGSVQAAQPGRIFDRARIAVGRPRHVLALADKHLLSLPTLELVERALVDTLHGLRQNVTGPADRDAGAIEYASWLRRLR